jgi:hypothetical protein
VEKGFSRTGKRLIPKSSYNYTLPTSDSWKTVDWMSKYCTKVPANASKNVYFSESETIGKS